MQPLTRILLDEYRVGDVIDDEYLIIAMALERLHQAFGIRQEGERHVLDVKLRSGLAGKRREEVEAFLAGGLSTVPGSYMRTVKFLVPVTEKAGAGKSAA